MDRKEAFSLALVGGVLLGLAGLVFGLVYLLVTMTASTLDEEARGPAPAFVPSRGRDGEIDRTPMAAPPILPKPAPQGPPPPGVEALVESMGSPDWEVRSRAERKLVALGRRALPALRKALEHADPEIRWRAAEAIERIEKGE